MLIDKTQHIIRLREMCRPGSGVRARVSTKHIWSQKEHFKQNVRQKRELVACRLEGSMLPSIDPFLSPQSACGVGPEYQWDARTSSGADEPHGRNVGPARFHKKCKPLQVPSAKKQQSANNQVRALEAMCYGQAVDSALAPRLLHVSGSKHIVLSTCVNQYFWF